MASRPEIRYPLSDDMLRMLIEDHFVAFEQKGNKVECVFPLTEDEEKWSNRHSLRAPGKFSMGHETEPDRSTPLTHKKVSHFLRNLVGPRFQRLTGFAHHITCHFMARRDVKITKRANEPLTIHFATEDEARTFANLALLAAVAKLAGS